LYYFSRSIKGERSIWDVIGAHLFSFLFLFFIVGAALGTTTVCSMEVNSSRLDPQFCFGDCAAEGVYVQQHERSPAVHVPDYEPNFIYQQWGIPNLICCYFQALEKKLLYPLWAFASTSKNTSHALHEQIRPHFTHKKIYLSAGAIAILYTQFIISPVGL
jgi:hypothetical protein